MVSAQEKLVRRVFHEDSNQPNPRMVLNEIFAADFVCHGPPEMEHSHAGGAEGLEKCIFNNALADLAFTVQSLSPDGDRVVARFTGRGRHVGAFRNLPPSGREVAVSGLATFRVADGRIVEAWGNLRWD